MDSIIDRAKVAWRSERLRYVPLEPDDQALQSWLQQNMVNDPSMKVLTSAGLFKPSTKKESAAWLWDAFPACLLAVAICLESNDDTAGANAAQREIVVDEMATSIVCPLSRDHQKEEIMIGVALLTGSSPSMMHNRHSELGVSLSTKYQGRGLGEEATSWLIDWGFRFANLHRIALQVFSHNKRAIALYKKLGFSEEGKAREHVLFDREWHDVVHMAILEHEWKEQKENRAAEDKQIIV